MNKDAISRREFGMVTGAAGVGAVMPGQSRRRTSGAARRSTIRAD